MLRGGGLVVLVVLGLVLGLVPAGQAARNTRVVRTRQGRVQGKVLVPNGPGLGPVEAFLGLPYAAAPVGRLRFMPPVAPQGWEAGEVRRVTEFGPVCPQIIPDLGDEQEALRFMTIGRMNYLKKLFNFLQQNQHEDCLYLNIYAPELESRRARLPVIVFIHGESYEWNSGNPYDGSVLASYGQVVVITLNYRLGLLGFLSADTAGVSGNQGLRDIQLALAWLQGRVSLFGGDPARVTVAGQSGGAWGVALLLASPRSVGLMAGAVLQSGPVLGPGYTYDTRQVGAEKARRLAEAVGCPGEPPAELEACLLEVPVEDIVRFKADFSRSSTSMGIVDAFAPDPVLPLPYEELISSGRGPQVPVILGENSVEGLMFSMAEVADPGLLDTYASAWDSGLGVSTIFFDTLNLPPALFSPCLPAWAAAAGRQYFGPELERSDLLPWIHILGDSKFAVGNELTADLLAAAPNVTVYRYLHTFQDNSSFSFSGTTAWGPSHGDELPYLWGMPTYGVDPSGWSAAARAHSALLLDLWASFARQEGPPGAGDLQWGPYSGPGGLSLLLGARPTMGRDPALQDRTDWWLRLAAQGC